MCVTNIYWDEYPNKSTAEYRQTEFCNFGQPGRPCQKHSILENPVRKIQFGEPSTEYMMTTNQRAFPSTPPRSSGGSHHRLSGGDLSSEEGRARRRNSKRRSELFQPLRASREHRKERIVIVDQPPTPPQTFQQSFSAPSSPSTPPIIVDGIPRDRGRPIIVDERPLPLPRDPSLGAVVGDRRRRTSTSRNRVSWDSPSSSHTSFDSRARREAEELERRELARREREREEHIAALQAERRREERIRAQDEEIRRRPAVPVPPAPLRQREYLRPVVDQPQGLPTMRGALAIRDERAAGERALVEAAEIRRRLELRDRDIKAQREAEDARKEELARKEDAALRQRLNRRFSLGQGTRTRRHSIVYDDGAIFVKREPRS